MFTILKTWRYTLTWDLCSYNGQRTEEDYRACRFWYHFWYHL